MPCEYGRRTVRLAVRSRTLYHTSPCIVTSWRAESGAGAGMSEHLPTPCVYRRVCPSSTAQCGEGLGGGVVSRQAPVCWAGQQCHSTVPRVRCVRMCHSTMCSCSRSSQTAGAGVSHRCADHLHKVASVRVNSLDWDLSIPFSPMPSENVGYAACTQHAWYALKPGLLTLSGSVGAALLLACVFWSEPWGLVSAVSSTRGAGQAPLAWRVPT